MLMVPVAASTLIPGPAVAAGAGEAFGAAVEPEQAESSRATIRTGFKCSPFSRDGIRRSEEHTSELQSHLNLVCRLLLEKKKPPHPIHSPADGHINFCIP